MTVPIPSWYWVYIIPYAAVLLILLVVRSPSPQWADRLRKTCWLLIVGGLAVSVWALAVLPGAIQTMYRYQADPSCSAGLALQPGVASGECSIVDAILTGGTATFGRRSTNYREFLDLSFGTRKVRVQVIQGGDLRWTAPAAARVQEFRGKSVLIGTDRGTAVTVNRPDQVVLYYELWLGGAAAFVLLGLATLYVRPLFQARSST